jgi:hypothetical protein
MSSRGFGGQDMRKHRVLASLRGEQRNWGGRSSESSFSVFWPFPAGRRSGRYASIGGVAGRAVLLCGLG